MHAAGLHAGQRLNEAAGEVSESPYPSRISQRARSSWRPARTGSWWPDYDQWLAVRSGDLQPAPQRRGSHGCRPLGKAPGTYVHES